MKLTVCAPLAILAEVEGVAHVRAEDATGAFGILPGHADFLTVLSTSVVTWRDGAGHEHHAAVRGGVFEMRGGRTISITTREAVLGDDLQRLESEILAKFRREAEQERAAHADAERLYLTALQRIVRYLRPERQSRLLGPLESSTGGGTP